MEEMNKERFPEAEIMPAIASDILRGLSASPKWILPKYFYDEAGSKIFTEIMKMPEYYLTPCEIEILTFHGKTIAKMLTGNSPFRLIEFGPGDGYKSGIILDLLMDAGARLSYNPVDISVTSNDQIKEKLGTKFPTLSIEPVTGDYLTIPGNIRTPGTLRLAILFLGSNIGNLNTREMNRFFGNIAKYMLPGDCIVIGFDLKKSPAVIMRAYNDPNGLTARFNLNLLVRMNRELKTDFDIEAFQHHTAYDPVTGEVKSYIVSMIDQAVYCPVLGTSFAFRKWEPVFTELSKKYEIGEIDSLAEDFGFRVADNFTDHRGFFVDSFWIKK